MLGPVVRPRAPEPTDATDLCIRVTSGGHAVWSSGVPMRVSLLCVLLLGCAQCPLGEYQTRCARGACAARVLGLFRGPFHPEPIRGNGNTSEPSRYHLQLLSPVDHLLEKLFKYLTRCPRCAKTPPLSGPCRVVLLWPLLPCVWPWLHPTCPFGCSKCGLSGYISPPIFGVRSVYHQDKIRSGLGRAFWGPMRQWHFHLGRRGALTAIPWGAETAKRVCTPGPCL